MQFLAQRDKKIEFLGQSEKGARLCVGGGGGDRCLLDTAVVKSASCPIEGDVVPCCQGEEDMMRPLRSTDEVRRCWICGGCDRYLGWRVGTRRRNTGRLDLGLLGCYS